jgi:uncharacterized phiE125 gp8 family phage protein
MLTLSQVPKPKLVTGPTTEPITIHEAKKQVDIATSDTAHDTALYLHMQAARQQWEHDTQEFYVEQTWRLKLPWLCEFAFTQRPVSLITSVQYYDSGNASQTLSTDIYELNEDAGELRLKYLQTFPTTSVRWDAVTVTYVLGESADSTTVPPVAKQAMLLLVGYYFALNRGDADGQHDQRAYERLVAKYMRSTYP